MTAIHSKPPLLTRQNVVVESEGENVLVRIGNKTLTLHYESALQISQWIRMRAKEAKRRAGDMSRHWSAIATLEDLK
jgi:hypothetical protein